MSEEKRIRLQEFGPKKRVANILDTYLQYFQSKPSPFARTKNDTMDEPVDLYITLVTIENNVYVVQGRVVTDPPHAPMYEKFSANQEGEVEAFLLSEEYASDDIITVTAPDYFFPYKDNLKIVPYSWKADEPNIEVPLEPTFDDEPEEGERIFPEDVNKFVMFSRTRHGDDEYGLVTRVVGDNVTFQHVQEINGYEQTPANQMQESSWAFELEAVPTKDAFTVWNPFLTTILTGNKSTRPMQEYEE